MLQSPDSLYVAETSHASEVDTAPVVRVRKPQHPYEVLRQLPYNATEGQKDSAIQANFKPAPIRWSQCPDTLRLPGDTLSQAGQEVSLSMYYKGGFFPEDSLFNPDAEGIQVGVAGDPVPYNMQGDNLVTGLLIVCFVVALISFSNTLGFIERQGRRLFNEVNAASTADSFTSGEMRFQFFLVMQTSLLLGILYYYYSGSYASFVFLLPESWQMLALYSGVFLCYFVLKWTVCSFVNWTFFERLEVRRWNSMFLFITSMEGVALFPLVLLQVYFDWSMVNTLIYFIFVIVFAKIISFYKSYSIFFNRKGFYMRIILYLCALEILPLLALWGALGIIESNIKINI